MADTTGQEKSLATHVTELYELVLAYAKQETLDPVKSLGRFIGFGVAGSLACGLGAVIMLLGRMGSLAQKAGESWKPEGNVEFVVGAGAGGENDRIARAIQHALTKEHLIDSMTVMNRPGAAQTSCRA